MLFGLLPFFFQAQRQEKRGGVNHSNNILKAL